MVTPGSLGGVINNALTQSARDVGSIPALGTIFPIVITHTRLTMPPTLGQPHRECY